MVKYKYDAWGNVSVLDGSDTVNTSGTFIGNMNPFRYKGYYYDKDTEFWRVLTKNNKNTLVKWTSDILYN